MADADIVRGQPLRILHLASSGRWTGVAEPATALALEQQRQGCTVAFGCIGGGSFQRKLELFDLPQAQGFYFDRRLHPGRLWKDIQSLRELLRSFKPDVVHCHLPHDHWTASLVMRRPLSRRFRRIALVRTMHRETAPRADLMHRWLAGKGTDMVIAISQSQRRCLIEEVGLPGPRVAWVRGAVDLQRFRPDLPPEQIRVAYHFPRDAIVAGLIARMQNNRGHHLFIDTLKTVVTAVPNSFYVIAGRGELKEELIARIRQNPLKKHLRRLGYRKFDLPETYAAMDVVVLVTPGSDGSGRAMLEAMACGRPVVGADFGAISDTIESGVNGFLFQPWNREDFARALIDALGNPERLRTIGKNSRHHAEQFHSHEKQYAAVLEVYEEARARRRKLQIR